MNGSPPVISIDPDGSYRQIVELLAHELARVVEGPDAENGPAWVEVYRKIENKYLKAQKKIENSFSDTLGVSLLKEEASVLRASTKKFTPAEGGTFRQKTGCRDQHYREDAWKYFFGKQSMVGRKAKIRIFPKKKKPQIKEGVLVYDSRDMIVVQYGKSGWKESFTATDMHDGSVEISLS